MTDSAVASLSDAKKALLEKLMKERGLHAQAKPVPPGIAPRPAREVAPLSHAQRSLWFINELEGASSTYNMGGGLRIDGELSVPALRTALQHIAERHEILRTHFLAGEDGPQQRIDPQAAFPLHVDRVQAENPEQALQQGYGLLQRHAAQTFDLGRGPLIRAFLVELGEQRHLLFFSMHHIVSDAWSMNVLFQEVFVAYQAALAGQAPSLPPLAVQYGDYAHWQAQPEQQQALAAQAEYWTRQLGGVPHQLALPTDKPRPARLSSQGGAVSFELDAELSARLQQLARANGATVFMLLLACWQLLLWKASRQDDFVVGISTLNRQRKELEPLIGYFVNSLAVRCRPQPQQRLSEFLAQVRTAMTDAYAHPDLPFERVVEMLGVERGLDRAPLAQARFAFANVQGQQAQLPGLRFSPLEMEQRELNAKCDLLLVMWPNEERLGGTLQYSTDLFEADTAQRWVARLRTVLESACADPGQTLQSLQHLPESERAQIAAWQGQVRDWGTVATLPELVAAQARLRPQAPAVVCGERMLDYAGLSAAAAGVAAALRARGVGRGDRVGVCTSRSPEFVIGLLGAMAAGAAYVPLDRSAPPARLAAVAGEAGLSALLLDRPAEAARNALEAAGLACLWVEDCAAVAAQAADWPGQARPEDAAYVIFTSGSTGKPKGVQVPHRAVFNYVRGLDSVLELPAQSEYLALSTIAADLGNTALFGALCGGGCLRLLADEASLDPERLAAALAERPVDCLKIVPSHFEMLLRTGDPQRLLPRRCLVFGGEPLSAALVERVRAIDPALAIVNHYGPTETTIGVLTHRIGQDLPATVPLGRPLPNVAAYLLGPDQAPVGVGEVGELYFGGACVADGYLGDADGSAARFLPDPFAGQPQARMYRSGDLARRRSDGELMFLGRGDHQVKIRGHRVELSEVDAVVRAVPGVRDCAVLTRSGAAVDEALAAWVVLAAGASLESVRSALRERLPEYMVPADLAALEALPLNANGKIDRARLLRERVQAAPASATATVDSEDAPLAGRQATRDAVRAVWEAVLAKRDFGDQDRFFDIGGHSLMATLAVFRLRKALAPALTVRDLFEHPTVAALAAFIDAAAGPDTGEGSPALPADAPPAGAIVARPRPERLPLTYTQERLWFVDQMAAGSAAYNVPLGLRLKGALDKDALRRALAAIVARHESLRTVFHSHDGLPVQVVQPPAQAQAMLLEDPLPAGQGDSAQARVDAARKLEVTTPFDLAQGPLIRARLVELGRDDHALLVTMHHIVSDGWSNEVIAGELGACYAAYRSGAQPELAPLPIQYADYALWEREQHGNGVLAGHIDYWKRRLAGAPEATALPLDRPRSPQVGSAGASVQFRIPAELAQAARTLAAQAGTTPFVLLQAVFKLLLSKYSGQHDIVVGTTHANRARPELEPLVGFFVNQVPLRSVFDPTESARALLRREAASVAEDFSHHELPLNLLVSSMAMERRIDQAPIFQALFVLQNVPPTQFALPGLELERIDFDIQEAKFDLSLFVVENEDGLLGAFTYKSGLFDEATIRRMGARLTTLLANLVARPDQTIGSLEMISATEIEEERQAKARMESDKLSKLRSVRRRTVSASGQDMVSSAVFDSAKGYPLCVRPLREDVDLAAWAAANREWIERELRVYGAILFRGFGHGAAPVDFESFAAAVSDRLIDEYGDLPRDSVSGRVYKSTPYPSDKAILIHNESSHLHRYPTKIFFSCVIPARSGGESPILDCRALYKRLDPALVEKMRRKKLKYVRNYIDSVDVSWQHFFQTEDRAAVEAYCRRNDIEFEWFGDSGLRTSVVCDAVRKHQVTGEDVFFNQICLHHISCVDPSTRDSLIRLYGLEGLPRNVYYGDGEPIEDEVVAELRRAVDELSVQFPWEKHDVIMVDNVLCAHARNPFEGERKIVVAIADIFDDRVPA